MFKSMCPIFPSRNFEVTSAFYNRLGFRICALYEAAGYLILQRDDVELHFFSAGAIDPTLSDHAVFVRIHDAKELSKEFQRLDLPTEGIPRFCKAEDKSWAYVN